MAGGDVRAVLQYVPQFGGRTFVIQFDEDLPEPAVAEALLDLKSLQVVGVRLVIVIPAGDLAVMSERATELEIKFAVIEETEIDDRLSAVRRTIERGQAAFVRGDKPDLLEGPAIEIGVELSAAKVIALAKGPGILKDGKPLHAVPSSTTEELLPELEEAELLRRAAEVCESGVSRVHVLDGRQQGVLVEELFSNEGVGTMVHADSYREVRALREEDVPELLAMIGRSVRREHLVPRDYEDVLERSEDFLVLCVDENVVGCVALHAFDHRGEIACLYVKQSHEGLGYGRLLVKAAEDKAAGEGLKSVFALTATASSFFEGMGYAPDDVANMPEERAKKLAESTRDSDIFSKSVS